MIKSLDRSGWFGASDTHTIMGSWNTKTFETWWLVKLGLTERHFTTLAMQTGTALEHRILRAYGVERMDRQIRKRSLRLRVNLDGEADGYIFEVKTHGGPFKVSKAYWQQAQVEHFAAKKPVIILAYHLEPEDYKNWYRPIDIGRMAEYPIDYDEAWIRDQYLPRLRVLADCFRKGVFPNERQIH